MKLPSFAKLFIVFYLITFCFLSFPSIVFGQQDVGLDGASAGVTVGNWATPIEEMQQIRDQSEGFNLEKSISTSFLYFLYLFDESVSGKIKEGKKPSPKDPATNEDSGAIDIVGNYISQIITQPPTSSVEYIADLGRQINPVKPAYAQGTGYQGLSGVLEIWKGFRNLAYALFVIIFVVVGFMIMFRTKLNPQTVVSLQLALPKLIITLLLITFSYAISGFIIDLIYFTIYLAVGIFHSLSMTDFANGQAFLDAPFTDIIAGFKPNEITIHLSDSLKGLFPQGPITDIASKIVFGQVFLRVVIGGAILFSVLKLLIQLVMAYVNILLQVIFAPIILLFNALPQSNSFSSWVKNLIANAAAFPAAAIMILVGSALATGKGSTPSSDTFIPPFLGSLSGVGEFSTNIIGLGTILLLPKIVSMIQEALKAKSAFPVGAAVAEGAAIGTAPIRSWMSARKERKRMEQQAELYKQP